MTTIDRTVFDKVTDALENEDISLVISVLTFLLVTININQANTKESLLFYVEHVYDSLAVNETLQ